MESRKLTSADIDRVRDIEGFPIATDEAIIELSDIPCYTACPNPYIEEFISEYGTPYDEATDDYHREPFSADVSEGKNDSIYNAHTYHTKVPYKAIARYILHYTNPGDVILDGFCGTGMTGVAAAACESPQSEFRMLVQQSMGNVQWGKRHAILSDLSPAATFIAYNYNHETSVEEFDSATARILKQLEGEYGWMFQTNPINKNGQLELSAGGTKREISFTAWSDVLICPHCGEEIVFYNAAFNSETGKVADTFSCPACNSTLKKKDCERALDNRYDEITGEVHSTVKQVPIAICYMEGRRKVLKTPDSEDLALIERIEATPVPAWVPTDLMMGIGSSWGDSWRAGYHTGMSRVHQFFYKRTLIYLSRMLELIEAESIPLLKSWFTSQLINISKLNRYRPKVSFPYNPLSGTLYISSMICESNPRIAYENKVRKFIEAISLIGRPENIISLGSSTHLLIPDETVDYVFIDPPFGDNLMYSELSFIWEAWLKCKTNNGEEAIINSSQNKGLLEYQRLITECFREFYRVLKPGRWMTVEFHNSKNAVWNAIQEALLQAGFIVADVRTLDKQQGSFKQVNNVTAVKQDLIISVYKPKDEFIRQFNAETGTEETVWAFIRQHLDNIPVVVESKGNIELIAERQSFLLFDRMVAYHVMQGIPVPLDAADFYRGLDERFLKRDDMYFLPDQVTEYDTARMKMDVESVQFALLVTNEKTAIGWLYQLLANEPMTYQQIQPKFMQEVKTVDRYEAMPELAVLLEENFLQDDKGRWYVPDTKKEGDIAKLREKSLLREFDGYLKSKGKLKLFRSEAIRVGFSHLWKDKNYQAIVDLANRLPAATIQEDPNLLMYYDISLSRVG